MKKVNALEEKNAIAEIALKMVHMFKTLLKPHFLLELDRVWISSGSRLVASLGFGFEFVGFQNSKKFRVRVFWV